MRFLPHAAYSLFICKNPSPCGYAGEHPAPFLFTAYFNTDPVFGASFGPETASCTGRIV